MVYILGSNSDTKVYKHIYKPLLYIRLCYHATDRNAIAHPKLFHYWFLFATSYNINLFNFRFSERINLQRIGFNLFNLQLTIVNSGDVHAISDSQRYINIYIFVYITTQTPLRQRFPPCYSVELPGYFSITPNYVAPNIYNGEFTQAIAPWFLHMRELPGWNQKPAIAQIVIFSTV